VKPLNQAVLVDAVEPGSGANPPGVAESNPMLVFNRAELIDRLGGDTELLTEVVHLFLEDCPHRLAAIKSAVDLRNPELIRSTAHALKGAAGTLAARGVFEAAQALEQMGAEARLEPTEAAWRTLSKEAASLMETFRQIEAAV
jgi:two-component system, sensor histidine kinase and response regulator